MSTATYAGLRAAVRAGSPKPDDMEPKETAEDEEDADEAEAKPKGKKKDQYMTESETNDAIASARAEGFAQATARANAVLASEHYTGREALATTMLANEKLSADEITTFLAAAPKAAAPAAPAAAETDDEAARAELRQNLAAEQPEPTGQAAEEEPQADNSLVDNMKARFGLK
jgi:hypothetical protein